MRILVAPDKFKGSLTSEQVAQLIAAALGGVLSDAVIETMPIADGGEGTANVISQALCGERITCPAHDALGHEIEAEYFWLAERRTAVMEMSAAAGLWRIVPEERDLLRADTFGVGEMIKDAVRRDVREILIGLGGSATNDGGFGMARALGFQFPANEHEIESPAELVSLARIICSYAAPDLTALSRQDRERASAVFPRVVAAVDVRNPLLGSRGATRTFGPQKGGTSEQLEILESGLTRLADVVARDLGSDFRNTPGAGAAGGLGFGLMSFCGATVKSGFEVVAEFIGLSAAIANADVVITGEGRLDEQSLEGKAPAGVARLAREAGKRVFAIAGSASDAPAVRALFDNVLVLARPPITPTESTARASELLLERARELAGMM
ncbi:MAG TPA: glycerate kinase [Chthoniobacterales bacterium]|nr:glycerate kinase [Chthoniobacterales bacterium]